MWWLKGEEVEVETDVEDLEGVEAEDCTLKHKVTAWLEWKDNESLTEGGYSLEYALALGGRRRKIMAIFLKIRVVV
jgi:hypothetical protein